MCFKFSMGSNVKPKFDDDYLRKRVAWSGSQWVFIKTLFY